MPTRRPTPDTQLADPAVSAGADSRVGDARPDAIDSALHQGDGELVHRVIDRTARPRHKPHIFPTRARAPRWAILSLTLLAGAGCSGGVGTDLNQLDNDPLVDAGATAPTTTAFVDPFAGAAPYASQTGPATHNAGTSCLQSGCHAQSGTSSSGAPNLMFGGTVFSDYTGNTPAAGVEVRVMDARGNAVSAYTSSTGTFYLFADDADGGVAFPLTVGARNAAATRPMITTVTSQLGSCGQQTCHVAGGGTTSSGNYYPIHVP